MSPFLIGGAAGRGDWAGSRKLSSEPGWYCASRGRWIPPPEGESWELVGTEDALLQQLADSMLKEDCASELKVHLARSLPLPSNVNRPRIDLIVFVVNLHSKYRGVSSYPHLSGMRKAFCLLHGKVYPLVCPLAPASGTWRSPCATWTPPSSWGRWASSPRAPGGRATAASTGTPS
ncbi:centromere protein M isoform X3 [Ursus maritimus]|uniref:Centromere protein M n=1 Tax=Ursus maritimus TaxID=29073 RepID=A0A8M1GD27_URSMA|nr:centromere protein M isoform X3 [Ursus maritimus]